MIHNLPGPSAETISHNPDDPLYQYFSIQTAYEAPKTDDQNEINFVKLDDDEFRVIRNKMLRMKNNCLNQGHSWMSIDCPNPFSEL